MKKFAVLAALALTVLLCVNVTPAKAQTFCYSLTGYCDKIQLTKDGYGGWIGLWDSYCNGLPSSIAGKGAHLATKPVSGGVPNSQTFRFRFWKSYGVFDLYGTDGTFVTQYQWFSPFSKNPGPCVFVKPEGAAPEGMPSSAQR